MNPVRGAGVSLAAPIGHGLPCVPVPHSLRQPPKFASLTRQPVAWALIVSVILASAAPAEAQFIKSGGGNAGGLGGRSGGPGNRAKRGSSRGSYADLRLLPGP